MKQLEHLGGARFRGSKGKGAESTDDPPISFPCSFLAWIRSLASWMQSPSLGVIWRLDRFLFSFSFSLAARRSWFSFARRAALCIAISQPLISCCIAICEGLWDRCLRSFLTEDACFRNCWSVRGVPSQDELVDWLARLGGGVGVEIWIFSFSSTLSGFKGWIPAAAKPFWIFRGVNTSRWAAGYALRKSNLLIWLYPKRIFCSTRPP
jgi:hypothetical protein